jgi:hypothetical protein
VPARTKGISKGDLKVLRGYFSCPGTERTERRKRLKIGILICAKFMRI